MGTYLMITLIVSCGRRRRLSARCGGGSFEPLELGRGFRRIATKLDGITGILKSNVYESQKALRKVGQMTLRLSIF